MLQVHPAQSTALSPSQPTSSNLTTATIDRKPQPADSGLQPADPSPQVSVADGERFKRDKLVWSNIIWIILLHLGLLAAPWTFSWPGLVVMVGLHWLTGGGGICLGFHRLFTHRSFSTYRPVAWFIAWLGGLAGEGGVIHWVANHRKHHAHSDREGDPHSPNDGAWWSHMLWMMRGMSQEDLKAYNKRWAPDVMKDRVLRFLDRTFMHWNLGLAALLFFVGYAWSGVGMGFSLLVWGMVVRLVAVLHSTFLINSATHMWGYRNYDTKDNSRNLWWVALLSYGEGWHNNHHAYPGMARCGHRWWEIDLTYQTIRLMSLVGLAWNVVDSRHGRGLEK